MTENIPFFKQVHSLLAFAQIKQNQFLSRPEKNGQIDKLLGRKVLIWKEMFLF